MEMTIFMLLFIDKIVFEIFYLYECNIYYLLL